MNNILDHEFKFYCHGVFGNTYYICNKCSGIIYNIERQAEIKFMWLESNPIYQDFISCDEFIIKNIIE